jgi:hypothetical protein
MISLLASGHERRESTQKFPNLGSLPAALERGQRRLGPRLE